MGFGGKKRKSSTADFKVPTPKIIKKSEDSRRASAPTTTARISSSPKKKNSILKNKEQLTFLTIESFTQSTKSSFDAFLGHLKEAYSDPAPTCPEIQSADRKLKKHFLKVLLPSLTENVAKISENDPNHKRFITDILQIVPWWSDSFSTKHFGKFLTEIIAFKPAFKITILSALIDKSPSFNNDQEVWFESLVADFINRDPMLKHDISTTLKQKFPPLSSAISTIGWKGYATYIRLGLNFCLKTLTDFEDQCDLFNNFLTQLIRIDALLPEPIDKTSNQQKTMLELIDHGLSEFLNAVVVYKPLEIIKETVFQQIMLKNITGSFCGWLFFVCFAYEPVKLLKFVLGKIANKSKVLEGRRAAIVLGSLLAHSKSSSKMMVERTLKILVRWCVGYIRDVEASLVKDNEGVLAFSRNVKSAVEKHGNFYATVSAILQIIVTRQSSLFTGNHDFIKSLNLNNILLHRITNPLFFCTDELLKNYNNLMLHFRLPAITSKISENKDLQSLESMKLQELSKTDAWNPLGWFDTFDSENISYLEETKKRFVDDLEMKFEDLVKRNEELLNDSGITNIMDKTIAAEESDSDESTDSDSSSFGEMEVEEIPVLERLLRRERSISERSL